MHDENSNGQRIQAEEIVIEFNEHRPGIALLGPSGGENENISFEVGNTQVYFFPARDAFRSRFVPKRQAMGAPAVVMQMDDIPGQRAHLNVKGKKARITDPLKDSCQEKFFRKVNGVISQVSVFRQNIDAKQNTTRPQDDQTFTNLDEPELLKWEYWMTRLVEENKADLIQGTLRSSKELTALGKVPKPQFHHDPTESPIYGTTLKRKELEMAGSGK